MCFSLPQSKALQVDTSLTLSMTRVLSLREFAKRERANSWQSKGKFAFKFVDCHANFCKICSQWRRILSFWAERVSIKRPSGLQGVATAKKSTYKDGKALSFWAFCKKAKNPKNLRHALNLWILRFLAKAQYDNVKNFWIYLAIAQYDNAKSVRYDKTSQYDKVLCHFV